MIRWERSKLRYFNGYDGYLGETVLMQVHYDGATSRDQKEKYEILCQLPGFKKRFGHYMTEEEAKEHAEAILGVWLKKTELTHRKDHEGGEG
jgi:hypothetical protein